jgi:hypothetical protein
MTANELKVTMSGVYEKRVSIEASALAVLDSKLQRDDILMVARRVGNPDKISLATSDGSAKFEVLNSKEAWQVKNTLTGNVVTVTHGDSMKPSRKDKDGNLIKSTEKDPAFDALKVVTFVAGLVFPNMGVQTRAPKAETPEAKAKREAKEKVKAAMEKARAEAVAMLVAAGIDPETVFKSKGKGKNANAPTPVIVGTQNADVAREKSSQSRTGAHKNRK